MIRRPGHFAARVRVDRQSATNRGTRRRIAGVLAAACLAGAGLAVALTATGAAAQRTSHASAQDTTSSNFDGLGIAPGAVKHNCRIGGTGAPG